jgi:iron complex outermembrane receptor protein
LHLGDQWSITGGLRLSAEEHRVSDMGTGSADHPALTIAENDSDGTSWRLDLEYAATASALVYAGVSTGFKSGGITTTVLPSGDFNSFDAEDLTAYEIGFKAQRPDRRLTVNAAVFYYDFSDLQISSVHRLMDRVIVEVENAGKAEIYGIDAAGSFRISDRLTAAGGVVWMPRREFIEFESEITEDVFSGNELSRAPEWTATAALDYEHPLRDRGSVSARFEYSYRSDFFFTAENDPRYAQGGFGLLNALLKFEPATGKWYVFASGRNLTDQDYFNQVFIQSSPGYPDTYEVGIGYFF